MKIISKMIVGSMLLVLLSSTNSNAQSAFEKGKSYVSVGYGYQILSIKSIYKVYDNPLLYSGFSVSGMGPIRVNYEYAVSDKLGVGLNIGYTSASVKFTDSYTDGSGNTQTYNYKYKYSKLTILPRLNWHLGESEKVDPYIGFGIGFKKVTYALETNDPNFQGIKLSGLPVGFDATFGCRFLFTPNIGAYVEVGAGHGFLQGGLVAKF